MSEGKEYSGWSDPDAQARGWLVRLKSGEATQQDLDMLAGWRSESDENEESFKRALWLWNDLGAALTEAGAAPVPGDVATINRAVSRRWVLGGAGGVAMTAVLALMVGGAPVPAGATVFETRKGERRRLQLEDQVRVDLNTESRLFYWADAVSPRVALDRGEAIFSASCDGDRYLLARMGAIEVRAQTAGFLLRNEGDMVRVACLEGSLTFRSGGKEYTLSGGMEADFDSDARQPDTTELAESQIAWQRDILQFKDRPAEEVIEELNRYRPGRVYLLGDRSNVRITGVIHLSRADLAVDHIARSLGMSVVRLPGGIAILRAS